VAGTKRRGVSFMPHIISAYSEQWSDIANDAGLHYIDPRDSIDKILQEIRESELLLTEAMHGAIVADAFRVPWIRVQSGERHAPTFKWLDWTESLGINHESYWLPFLWRREAADNLSLRARLGRVVARERLRWIRRTGRPRLSTAARSDEAYERLLENVAALGKWLDRAEQSAHLHLGSASAGRVERC
jgi:Polysaccharide pyruvyl transferase